MSMRNPDITGELHFAVRIQSERLLFMMVQNFQRKSGRAAASLGVVQNTVEAVRLKGQTFQ